MRVYTVPLAAATLPATNPWDVFQITPAANKPVALLGMTIDNVGIAVSAGDAHEQLLAVNIYRGFTVAGSGGSTPTIYPVQRNDAAAGFTVTAGNTTVATTSGTIITAIGWNDRVPLREFWPMELCVTASASDTTLVIRIAANGASSVSLNANIWVAELL